jgi:hypothetical protein
MADVPQPMQGESPDNDFEPEEMLYHRYEGPPRLAREQDFRLGNPIDMSMNRGKYSSWRDVLHPNCCDGKHLDNWSVWRCQVRDITDQSIW